MLDYEIDALDRGEDRIDRNLAEGVGFLGVGGTVPSVATDPEIHVENRVRTIEGRNRMVVIDQLNFRRPLDVAGGHRALGPLTADIQVSPNIAVKFCHATQADALEVEDNFRHILTNTRDRGELVPDVIDTDAGNRASFKGTKQNPAQRIAEGGAVAWLQWLDLIAPVVAPRLYCFDGEFGCLQQAD
ncbi:MAG: hypothetical protein WKF81_14005 [Thermomicrobiales bacterium]